MPQATTSSSVPVNIITGALGAGKTTAIARLLADKPADEFWLVILNEFTDTGIDAVTLAAAARGAYDVRMIPGGCLCCTGEEDFRRQLSVVLNLPVAQQPARILIEPSGIGHPGAIVEELRSFERSGALRLLSTVVLIDVQREGWLDFDAVAQTQIDAADVLVLSKAELATQTRRQEFLKWAQQLYPMRRLIDYSERGVLPTLALNPPPTAFSFEAARRSQTILLNARGVMFHQHDSSAQVTARQLQLSNAMVQARTHTVLGRTSCGWTVPGDVLFDLPQLQQLLASPACWQGVERFKAVLRTGVECWHLVQCWQRQSAVAECNWAQDSRIEVQMTEGALADWSEWDRRWQSLTEPCPVG
jgi:G3E family GTPase